MHSFDVFRRRSSLMLVAALAGSACSGSQDPAPGIVEPVGKAIVYGTALRQGAPDANVAIEIRRHLFICSNPPDTLHVQTDAVGKFRVIIFGVSMDTETSCLDVIGPQPDPTTAAQVVRLEKVFFRLGDRPDSVRVDLSRP